jgi:Sulfotransferase domain
MDSTSGTSMDGRVEYRNIKMETLEKLLTRNGLASTEAMMQWLRDRAILINDQSVSLNTKVNAGDTITLRNVNYRVHASNDPERLTVEVPDCNKKELIASKIRVHCGYHKCLTMYFRKVFRKVAWFTDLRSGTYRHFYHRINEFYRDCPKYTISSISGHMLDFDRFEDIKVTRFIRDPRDLLISSYYYHKRAGEDWCNHIDPTDNDWGIVDGVIPKSLPKGKSFAQYLNEVSLEEGLLAELEFRKNHFDSMLQWPDDDPRILTYRYEDIIGNEINVFNNMFEFYELPFMAKKAGLFYVYKYSAKNKKGKSKHIRDPSSEQWKKYFTPAVTRKFEEEYGALLEKLRY